MTYVQAIEAAGGIPVVVPPLADRDVPRMLARLDGLVLSGGPDLAPCAYGAGPHVQLGVTEPQLDGFEYAMAREAARLRAADPRHLSRRADAQRRPRRHPAPALARCCGRRDHPSPDRRRPPADSSGRRGPRKHAGRSTRHDGAERQLIPPPSRRPPRRRSACLCMGAGRNDRGDRGPRAAIRPRRSMARRGSARRSRCIWRCLKCWQASRLDPRRCDAPLSAGLGTARTGAADPRPICGVFLSIGRDVCTNGRGRT